MTIPDYAWRSPDPATLTHLSDREVILFWIAEYDRLIRVLIDHHGVFHGWPGSPEHTRWENEHRAMRTERDCAAARVIGFTKSALNDPHNSL